ncbi:efflux RND transporter periplasmic adaptor subunit [Micromonospora rubida]|uniref:efflux RND transporter periplasmic adaptor subunit n=1 Tax=Micromonospora rubida TaxID=2697657 RepID=UPI0013786D73|nr:efflux RND transporter periplasmic adaptor subunit [Micromonospora rubida]NBE81205.1 efflux RND transporter periplasmic adaptor subunit [Micromonospora rubida]
MGVDLKRLRRTRRTRRARRGVAGAVVVLLLGAAGAWALTATADEAPAPAVTVAVDRGPVVAEVATSGTVQPATTRGLAFTVAGTVQSVAVRPGDVVRAGQQLAAIADDDAATAAGVVDRAEDDLAEARDALARARTPADDATGATDCATGSGARPVAWRSPESTTTATPSAPAGSATAQPRPTATVTRPGATPSVTGGSTRAPTGAPGATGGGSPRTSAPGGSACAGEGTRGGGGADLILAAQRRVNQAEATLAEAREALAGTTITAPIRGTVLSVAGKVGSKVARGATLITLADTYAMQVEATFPEADAAALAVGQDATLALADQPDQAFPATVVQVDPVGSSDGTLVRYGVVLSFSDAPDDLLVGQSAAVTVETGSVPDALRVPSTALHETAEGTGAVRVGTNSEPRTVTVGLRGGQYTEITSGLSVGDLVLRSW